MKSISLDDLIETLSDYLDDSDMSEIPTKAINHLWDAYMICVRESVGGRA